MKKLLKKFFHFLGYEIRLFNYTNSSELLLHHFLKSKNIDLVIDIGANFGQYALSLIEHNYRGEILSFEPLSAVHTEVTHTSSCYPNWKIAERCALGDSMGETTINISKNSASSSILPMMDEHVSAEPESRFIGQEKTPVYRLDEYPIPWEKYKGVFLKIDAQGFEDRILNGAKKILSQIQGIELELSLVPLYKNQLCIAEMLNLLDDLGFVPIGIYPGFTDYKNARMLQVEGFFCRKI